MLMYSYSSSLFFCAYFSEPFLGHSIALLLIRLCCRAKLLRCLFTFVAAHDDDEVTVSHQTPTETCVCQIPSWKLHDLRKLGNRLEFFSISSWFHPTMIGKILCHFTTRRLSNNDSDCLSTKFHYFSFFLFPISITTKIISISHEYSWFSDFQTRALHSF